MRLGEGLFRNILQHSVWFTLSGASVLDAELEDLQISHALALQGKVSFCSLPRQQYHVSDLSLAQGRVAKLG